VTDITRTLKGVAFQHLCGYTGILCYCAAEIVVTAMAASAERQLHAAILEYLDSKRPSVADPDSLDVAIQCIAEAFGVDSAIRAAVRSSGHDLLSIYEKAIGSSTPVAGVLERKSYGGIEGQEFCVIVDSLSTNKLPYGPFLFADTPLFKKFLENITSKKYFGDFKEGSAEYEERFTKAVETFRRTAAGQKIAAVPVAVAPEAGSASTAALPNDDAAAEALKTEGNTHLSKGRLQEAIDCYSAAIQKAPTGKGVHIYYANRAAAKTSAEDYAGAIADATQATIVDPSFAKAHARLGVALEFAGKLPEAVAAYEKALQLDPSMEATKSNLSKCKSKLSSTGVAAAPRAPGISASTCSLISYRDN
jgi:predicted negative regulator of RcsB-dependent stress response